MVGAKFFRKKAYWLQIPYFDHWTKWKQKANFSTYISHAIFFMTTVKIKWARHLFDTLQCWRCKDEVMISWNGHCHLPFIIGYLLFKWYCIRCVNSVLFFLIIIQCVLKYTLKKETYYRQNDISPLSITCLLCHRW